MNLGFLTWNVGIPSWGLTTEPKAHPLLQEFMEFQGALESCVFSCDPFNQALTHSLRQCHKYLSHSHGSIRGLIPNNVPYDLNVFLHNLITQIYANLGFFSALPASFVLSRLGLRQKPSGIMPGFMSGMLQHTIDPTLISARVRDS